MYVSTTRKLRLSSTPSRNDHHSLPARDGDAEMPNIFAVVGEHREKSDHLLVLGEDGSYYDYALVTGQTLPVEPDQSWKTDETLPDPDEVLELETAPGLLLNS
jgi:hypothetical protein